MRDIEKVKEKRKLEAIAKHEEALEKEIEEIENDTYCPKCGSYEFVTRWADNTICRVECMNCKYVVSDESENTE